MADQPENTYSGGFDDALTEGTKARSAFNDGWEAAQLDASGKGKVRDPGRIRHDEILSAWTGGGSHPDIGQDYERGFKDGYIAMWRSGYAAFAIYVPTTLKRAEYFGKLTFADVVPD